MVSAHFVCSWHNWFTSQDAREIPMSAEITAIVKARGGCPKKSLRLGEVLVSNRIYRKGKICVRQQWPWGAPSPVAEEYGLEAQTLAMQVQVEENQGKLITVPVLGADPAIKM